MNNDLTIRKVKRNNNDTFPIFIGSKEESFFASEKSESYSYQGNMNMLEALLNDAFKCTLSEIKLGGGKEQVSLSKTFIKRYSNGGFPSSISKFSEELFGRGQEPSALFFEDVVELFKKTIFMYQFSYAHYILGKHNRMKYSFPEWCCGRSAQNVTCALWEAGIVSAVKVYNNPYDHAYVIIPFIIGTSSIKGIVLIDPTSDQLFIKNERKVRNLVRIITSEQWEYRTDWVGGKNLYPDVVEESVCFGDIGNGYEGYLQQAFQNPVVVV